MEQHFLTGGFIVTEENVNLLKSHTIYGKSYEVGDHIGYVMVFTGMDSDGGLILEVKTIADSEVERFVKEHTLYDNNKFVPNWMLPPDVLEDEPKIIVS